MNLSVGAGSTFALLAALATAGCASDTGETRFSFGASAGGVERPAHDPGSLTFTNERGWTITLTKATVTFGPVYLNVAPPLREEGLSRLLDFVVKPAWADGSDHLGAGRVVGEVLGQVTFDALSSELVEFPVAGSLAQERIRTSEVWFYPKPGVAAETTKIGPKPGAAAETGTVALDVAGSATDGQATVRFRGALVLDDAWLPEATAGSRGTLSITEIRKVRGIPSAFYPTEGGRLEVRFDVEEPFRGADFSNLENNPTDADGTKILVQSKSGKVTTDQVMTNLYQGLRSATGTYSVRWLDR